MTFSCHRIFSCTEMFFVKHRNRPSQKPPRVLGFQSPSNFCKNMKQQHNCFQH
ncbi:hypothetical protein R3I94_009550 [Phoxinus phoxinus]